MSLGSSVLPAVARSLDLMCFAHFTAVKHLVGGSLEAFSESIRELSSRLPLPARFTAFSDSSSVAKRLEANGKRLRRYEDERDPYQMPARLVIPFVLTLQREAPVAGWALTAEICAALGCLCVPAPRLTGAADLQAMGRVAREFGEFVEAWAPMAVDGRIDGDDAAHLPNGIQQAADLAAAALAAKAQLEAVLARLSAGGAG